MTECDAESEQAVVRFMANDSLIEQWVADVEKAWDERCGQVVSLDKLGGALLMVASAHEARHASERSQALNALYGNVNAAMRGKSITELKNLAQPSLEDYKKLGRMGLVPEDSIFTSRTRY